MFSYLQSIGQRVGSYLPQNEHATRVSEIETHVQELQDSINDRTGELFQSKILETKNAIQAEKTVCQRALNRLNGSYYQDPESSLKKAWDKLVEKVLNTIGLRVETRSDLDKASQQLDNPDIDVATVAVTDVIEAKGAILTYVRLETKRNQTQEKLNALMSTEKTPELHGSLLAQKRILEQGQKVLCGDYFQDPNGLLDQSWKAFKEAEASGSEHTELLYNTFLMYEEERKSNDAKLCDLQRQIAVEANPERSYEALTAAAINAEVESLNALKADEELLAGVNWRQTALGAASIGGSLLGISYL